MKKFVLSLSYGKDSLACLGAIEKLGWPLDHIVHAEVWATDCISADLPPMVEFKKKADAIIKERYGIEVEHICTMRSDGTRQTYEKIFYHIPKRKSGGNFKDGSFAGFPYTKGAWCNDRLKTNPLDAFSRPPPQTGTVVQYVGIAADEQERLKRLDGITRISPLAAIGWTEAEARRWCAENNLLSPIYTSATRGGCWFCHNQGVDQLRLLRKNYPDLWALLMKWDLDSPVPFHPNGRTVHDFDRRFQMEDAGQVPSDRRFRWGMVSGSSRKD